MKDNFYIDNNGNTVFRSSFYKKKGSCCKSGCLHCPFGYTLSTYGIKFENIEASNLAECKEIFNFHNNKDQAVQSLLDSAFGSKKKSFDKKNSYALSLKGVLCGVVTLINDKKVEFYLHEEFLDQGINEIHINAAKESLDQQK